MFVVPSNTRNADLLYQLLEAPYCQMSAEELLCYFQARRHIHYFSVVDEEQAAVDKLDGILTNRFCFNQESYQLTNHFDWTKNPSTDIEWLILLHKFYYAVGLGRRFHETGDIRYRNKWMALTKHWIDTVPVNFLSSDVTGRRIQNWIFAYRYFLSCGKRPCIDADFHLEFLLSIHQQVAYLCRNLTPARNHRTLELYAIFLAAVVFPELRGASGWLRFSITELQKNLQSDLLADGVHCELSTDYHHIVLRNFLGIRRLAAMNDIELPADMDQAIQKALEFSLYAHKPDGFIPAISDGDTTDFRELLQQGYELYGDLAMLYVATNGEKGLPPAQRSKTFPTSGYSLLRSGWGKHEAYADERYLFFDCAPLGAGNHGHLDLLNIEIAAYGRSLIVDPGRYTYDESGDINWRVLFRGTRYHNTVQVDGKNQTRYVPHIRKFKIQGPEPGRELKRSLSLPLFDYLHGIAISHEYPVVHERKVFFVAGEYWLICDLLRAQEPHDYELRFHLDPLAEQRTISHREQALLRVESPNLLILQPHRDATLLTLESGYVSPSYGIKHAAPVINFSRRTTTCCFYTLLIPYKTEQPQVSVTYLPVEGRGQMVSDTLAAGLMIHRRQHNGYCRDELLVSHNPGERFRCGDLATDSAFLIRRSDEQGTIYFCYDEASAMSESGAMP